MKNNDILLFAANLEEMGDLFEGDMIRPQDLTRNHINSQVHRWPNGEVPYVVEGSFSEYSVIISFKYKFEFKYMTHTFSRLK